MLCISAVALITQLSAICCYALETNLRFISVITSAFFVLIALKSFIISFNLGHYYIILLFCGMFPGQHMHKC